MTEWPVYRAQKVEKLDENDEPSMVWENYQEVAERLVDGQYWSNVPPIWGRYTIECTANDLPNSIKSPMVAAAVRVNSTLALYRQDCYLYLHSFTSFAK